MPTDAMNQNGRGHTLIGWLLCVLFAAVFSACSIGSGEMNSAQRPIKSSDDDRGNQIVTEYLKRDTAPYRKDRVRFTVREEDGKTEVSEVDVWRRQSGDVT